MVPSRESGFFYCEQCKKQVAYGPPHEYAKCPFCKSVLEFTPLSKDPDFDIEKEKKDWQSIWRSILFLIFGLHAILVALFILPLPFELVISWLSLVACAAWSGAGLSLLSFQLRLFNQHGGVFKNPDRIRIPQCAEQLLRFRGRMNLFLGLIEMSTCVWIIPLVWKIFG
jgi:hypothetical protein